MGLGEAHLRTCLLGRKPNAFRGTCVHVSAARKACNPSHTGTEGNPTAHNGAFFGPGMHSAALRGRGVAHNSGGGADSAFPLFCAQPSCPHNCGGGGGGLTFPQPGSSEILPPERPFGGRGGLPQARQGGGGCCCCSSGARQESCRLRRRALTFLARRALAARPALLGWAAQEGRGRFSRDLPKPPRPPSAAGRV